MKNIGESEMSIDDVLSSVKRMINDSNGDVLDLTDVVRDDGKISKIKTESPEVKSDYASDNIGSLLKAIAENDHNLTQDKHDNVSVEAHNNSNNDQTQLQQSCGAVQSLKTLLKTSELNKKSNKSLEDFMLSITKPIIDNWIEENLENIVRSIAEREISAMINRAEER